MLLKEQLGLDVPPVNGAPPPSVRPDWMDPSDVEKQLQPQREPLPMPDPMKVMTADASGSVPLPERAPDRSVQNFEQQQPTDQPPGEGTYKVPDRVQTDPAHLLVADVILGGSLSWLQAAADVATGAVPSDKFDEARQQHQAQIDDLKSQHGTLVTAAEKAVPFLTGLGIGIAKPARTLLGTAARGAAVAGAEGYVKGYTGGPAEEPSVSSNRMARGIGTAVEYGVLGAGAASIPGGVKAGAEKLEQRAAGKAADAAAQAAKDKKAASTAKGQATKKAKADAVAKDKAYADQQRLKIEAERGEVEAGAKQFEAYRKPPEKVSQHAPKNRELFEQDPVNAFNQQARFDPTVEGFAHGTGLAPASILAKLRGKDLELSTPAHRKLFEDLQKVDKSWDAFKKRGASATAVSTKSGGPAAGTAGGTSAAPAGSAKPKSAAGGSASASKRAPAKPRSKASGAATGPDKPRQPRKPKPTS